MKRKQSARARAPIKFPLLTPDRYVIRGVKNINKCSFKNSNLVNHPSGKPKIKVSIAFLGKN